MLRQSELTPLSVLDEDPALFDPSPEWFVPGLKPFVGDNDEDDDEGLGFRSLIEEPEVLTKAWQSTSGERAGSHRRRAKRRHRGHSHRSSADP